jgi:hypothetical protein
MGAFSLFFAGSAVCCAIRRLQRAERALENSSLLAQPEIFGS